MKIVILAGGFGTRLAEYTESIPKPMVPIGGKPILWHLMNSYASFGFKDFYLALGYKAEYVKEYFLNYHTLNSDFTVSLKDGKLSNLAATPVDWQVSLVDTGLNTLTGGRVKRMQKYIGQETFMLTYGDGLSDVNIADLLQFHKKHGKMVTVTAVHPGARFGELEINDCQVNSFQEKPQTKQGWINGGFFVIEPSFFNLIDGDSTTLERSPLETAASLGELMAYKHEGFWQCMDTKRDKDFLEDLFNSNEVPWLENT